MNSKNISGATVDSDLNDIFEAFEAIPEGAHPADLAAAAPTNGQRDEDEDEGFYIGDEFKDMDRLNYGVIATSKLFKSRKIRSTQSLLSCAACKLALIMECAKTCVMITKATPAYASSAA
eukprot:gene30380-36708_t